ncbi:PLP-dependent cysteine synthase family protein [Haloplanus sp. GCM10025708]|uniref:PLP-dependent cysteine synthase family protein n=1 Tax=Haloferacaceae TaxID=1644056 RepID=UPI0036167399
MAVDTDAVGDTPLVELDVGVDPTVYGKVEWFNFATLPNGGGSVKTRIGVAMLDAAEAVGELDPGQSLVEASSGNTGAALARVGGARGYDVEIVMPDDAGVGKVDAIRAADGDIRFVDSEEGYDAFVSACQRLVDAGAGYYPNQYENPANPGVHAGTTGPEIWRQTGGNVTHFVAGAGTGGTVAGVSYALAGRGVEIHGFTPVSDGHDIDGLKFLSGPDTYVPGTFDPTALDTSTVVSTATAREHARRLRRRHAGTELRIRDTGRWSTSLVRDELRIDDEFLVGPSSGACAALVRRLDADGRFGDDDVVVMPLPDRGDRYPERDLWAEYL